MDLHSKISFYITTVVFRELCYVSHWHGEIEPKYTTYEKFSEEFIKVFEVKEEFKANYRYLFNEDDEDEEEEVENDVNSIKELLLDFYPILRTTANGAMSNPCDDILNEILIPYFRK